MNGKLVFVIAVFLFQAVFAGLNIKNSSDISVGFKVFKDIPVFLTITLSVVAGAVIAFPLGYLSGRKNKKNSKKAENIKQGKNKNKPLDADENIGKVL